jgi:hypothetical protein
MVLRIHLNPGDETTAQLVVVHGPQASEGNGGENRSNNDSLRHVPGGLMLVIPECKCLHCGVLLQIKEKRWKTFYKKLAYLLDDLIVVP